MGRRVRVERPVNRRRDHRMVGDMIVVGVRGMIKGGGFDGGLQFGYSAIRKVPGKRAFVL